MNAIHTGHAIDFLQQRRPIWMQLHINWKLLNYILGLLLIFCLYLRSQMRFLFANAADEIQLIWWWIECLVIFTIYVWCIGTCTLTIPYEGFRALFFDGKQISPYNSCFT